MSRIASLTVLTERPVLGSFSKGTEGSRSLNFGLSGGTNCDTCCRYHPDNKTSGLGGKCYAHIVENRYDRVQLNKKLVRHEEAEPGELCRRALTELKVAVDKGEKVPWFRFSTNGSVPKPRNVSKDFKEALIELLDFCDVQNIPVHFPVESKAKYRFYSRLVGSRCVVRLSSQSTRDFVHTPMKCSTVAGNADLNRRERVQAAKDMAARRAEFTGRKVIVCPAVAETFLYRKPTAEKKAKCGVCTACSKPDIDVVYPLH